MPNIERLEQLGLTQCATRLKTELSVREKLATAYEKYRYLTLEKIQAFDQKLRKETEKKDGENQWGAITSYKRTVFTALAQYGKVPPDAALDALEAAQKDGCFDAYEVMTVEWHKEIPDPILFGIVQGCSDKFFIVQWDTDVAIEDILKDHEGWKFLEKKV